MKYFVEDAKGAPLKGPSATRAFYLLAPPKAGQRISVHSDDGYRSVVVFREEQGSWKEVAGAYAQATELGIIPSQLPTSVTCLTPPEAPAFGADQKAAYDDILAGKNVFVTGPGGNGKSYITRSAIEALRKRAPDSVAVCGSTGAAALNIGGMTIHSTLGTGWSRNLAEWKSLMSSESLRRAQERLDKVTTIFIDEVSMLTGDYIEMMNWWLNYVKQTNDGKTFFGGIQVVFSGDFLQLPPVVNERSKERKPRYLYAFESPAWQACGIEEHYLRKGYRQGDAELRKHLLRVRRGLSPEDTLDFFNTRVNGKIPDGIDPTQVFPTNREVDAVNNRRLAELSGPDWTSKATYTGHEKWVEAVKENMRMRDELTLRVGAEVILITNDRNGGWVNGTRGKLLEVGALLRIQGTDGGIFTVGKATQEMKDAKNKVVASVSQYPVILGWACTIHRAQGATLEFMAYDPSQTFERHMAYVALSRVKSLDGLVLHSRLRSEHVRASAKVARYYEGLLEKMKERAELCAG